MSFDTVLVANRGEIAVRVMKTAARMGYRTVAVYSDADAEALHVQVADVAVHIGPAPVSQSYLDGAKILAAAQRVGAQAIHPGYGFLSENADFARAVLDAGLVWIGPPPEAIEAMGEKAAAKARMQAAGVPTVPGYQGDDGDEALAAAAPAVGFPILVKASAGGGGRGMRRADGPDALRDAIRSARAEAINAFGDGTLLLERLVEGAHHVEVQVFADQHGNVIHLGERDCSVQRRHQKVVEEAPSPVVDADLRSRIGEAACAAARAVGYQGAGTVELLVADGEFFFLEMNTRLQVEHPVTECITGLDLVELQLRVAAGEPLPLGQEQVRLAGHAIEVRLYAEDPDQGYLPQPGPVLAWEPPASIRVDHGLRSRDRISPHYDPMVAKLIAHGSDREEARRKLIRALEETVFFGVKTNRDLLGGILRHPTFVAGQATTDFLDGTDIETPDADDVLPAALALYRGEGRGFRTGHPYAQPFTVRANGQVVHGRWEPDTVRLAREHQVQLRGDRVVVDGVSRRYRSHREGDLLFVRGSSEVRLEPYSAAPEAIEAGGDGRITMPMAGQVLAVDVAVGDTVEAGQVVAIVEAMKLETRLTTPVGGTVAEVTASVGAALGAGALVVRIDPGVDE